MWINAGLYRSNRPEPVDFQLPANAAQRFAALRVIVTELTQGLQSATAAAAEAKSALDDVDLEIQEASRRLVADPSTFEHHLQLMNDIQLRKQSLKDAAAQAELKSDEVERRLANISAEFERVRVSPGVFLCVSSAKCTRLIGCSYSIYQTRNFPHICTSERSYIECRAFPSTELRGRDLSPEQQEEARLLCQEAYSSQNNQPYVIGRSSSIIYLCWTIHFLLYLMQPRGMG